MKAHHDHKHDILTPLSLALRLILVDRKSTHAGPAEKRHQEQLNDHMLKVWRVAVWGDSGLWIHAAATSTAGFDESQLEEVMTGSMLYKLLRETLSMGGGFAPQSSSEFDGEDDDGDAQGGLTDFEFCVEAILRDKDIISPAVFDHALHSQKTEEDRKQLKAVNDMSRKQILVVVKKCVNFASITQ
jgi:hypothetical protein